MLVSTPVSLLSGSLVRGLEEHFRSIVSSLTTFIRGVIGVDRTVSLSDVMGVTVVPTMGGGDLAHPTPPRVSSARSVSVDRTVTSTFSSRDRGRGGITSPSHSSSTTAISMVRLLVAHGGGAIGAPESCAISRGVRGTVYVAAVMSGHSLRKTISNMTIEIIKL